MRFTDDSANRIPARGTGLSTMGLFHGCTYADAMKILAITVLFLVMEILPVNNLTNPAMAAFNETVAGARAQGMGGAFTAVADDATALYWNPAGLSQMKRHEIMFMYADKYDVTTGPAFTEQYFAYSSPATMYGTFGLHYSKEGSDSILAEKRMGISYGKRVGSRFSLGFNLNSLTLSPAINSTQRSAADPSMTEQNSVGVDLGFLLNITDDAKIALSVKNLGASFGVITEHHLDTILKMGVAVNTSEKMLLAMDANFKENTDENKENKFQISAGAEYLFTPQVAFRAGFNKGDLTAGCGFRSQDWNMDYAFLNHEIGNTHRVSFSMRFGAGENEEEPSESGLDRSPIDDPGPSPALARSRVPSLREHGVSTLPTSMKSGSGTVSGTGPDGPVAAFRELSDLSSDSGGAKHTDVAVMDMETGKVIAEKAVSTMGGKIMKAEAINGSRVAGGEEQMRQWKPLPKMVRKSDDTLSLSQVPDHLRITGNDGEPLVSLKYLAGKLKYHYSYDSGSRTASLFKLGIVGNDTFIRFKAGSDEAEKNRKPVSIGSKAELVKGTLAVPFARTCELLGVRAVK
ncbi:MAG: hypothetical protein CVV64_11160 [Candidatus Wallbacteria bacterium HGW-Wallbacteria-1]|jgi:hypothetical protein|uniref:Uncharacterized protein n=1 Tax=Candidatus Wallbacteria bacterium HGW-Wallbacteria-1 TaxID=2013854 RepID=A0A2N1PP26_9BACT|nr:MAG: hypothetical protein CVV64_11160 [Candidatus Wallbacteria bacterium HGW-Wallbacteria-1]